MHWKILSACKSQEKRCLGSGKWLRKMILSVLPLNLLYELIPCETSINRVSQSWALCPRATLVLLLTGLSFWEWFISFMPSYTQRHFPCSHHKHCSAGWISVAAWSLLFLCPLYLQVAGITSSFHPPLLWFCVIQLFLIQYSIPNPLH